MLRAERAEFILEFSAFAALQKICDRLGPGAVKSFFWRWVSRLPSPFTVADFRAGYVYESAFRQFEVSETCVFDRPQAGRMWFEGVIRDHLDIGRPDQIALIFGRAVSRRTPGVVRTRVLTRGVDPTLNCYYKSSRLKQYFKEGWALRTELVICNTYDFGIGRRVCANNWYALRAVGESANRQLCEAEAADAQPAPDVVTFCQVTRPSQTTDGCTPRHFASVTLASWRGSARSSGSTISLEASASVNSSTRCTRSCTRVTALIKRRTTYDASGVRALIVKVPHTRRYQLTALGRRVAVLFTKTYGRVLAPGLSALDPQLPADVAARIPLAVAWRRFEHAFEEFTHASLAAA
jgi:hypothetical protein